MDCNAKIERTINFKAGGYIETSLAEKFYTYRLIKGGVITRVRTEFYRFKSGSDSVTKTTVFFYGYVKVTLFYYMLYIVCKTGNGSHHPKTE